MTVQAIFGRCECSLITFIITDNIKSLSHCHCSQCRKLHGAAFATFVRVDSQKFEILSGGTSIKKYKSSQDLDRYFCSTCGSSIMCKSAHDETRIWLSLGLLDGVFDLPDEEHMFFSSRPVWDDHCYSGDKWDGFPSNWTGYEKGN